ncbi:MAG: LysE family translocator [Pseudomonadota bacterium]
MTIEQLVAFNLTLLAAIASPGPAFLILVRTSLASGRLAGIATGCGLAVMASTWTLMALLGLDAIFRLFPVVYTGAKIAGALYLLYIAYRTWRGARDPIDASATPARHAFRDGVLINLLNPKSVLFSAAVLVVIFPAAMPLADKGLVVLNHLVVEILVYSAMAVGLSTAAVSRQYLRAKVFLDRTAAVILGALGLRLLTSR